MEPFNRSVFSSTSLENINSVSEGVVDIFGQDKETMDKALIEKPEGYVEPERRPRGDRGPRRDGPAEVPEQNNEPEMF